MSLKIAAIEIENIGCLQQLEIKPDVLTTIEGRNGTGKSTILNALRSITESGHDPSILRKGAEEGSIKITLSDGVTITETITPDKTTRVVRHPEYGKISKAKEWIDKVINSVSFDPARFLTAKQAERTAIFLQSLPIKLEASQLGFLPAEIVRSVDLDKHPLEVIGNKFSGLYGAIYKERTEINRLAKDKRSTAAETERNLPPESQDGQDWSERLSQMEAEFKQLVAEHNARIEQIKADQAAATEAEKALCSERCAAVSAEGAAEIEKWRTDIEEQINRLRLQFEHAREKITANCEIEIKSLQSARDRTLEQINKNAREASDALNAKDRPEAERLQREIGEVKKIVEQNQKAAGIREVITRLNTEATQLEEKSEQLTVSLKKLDALKSSLLEKLPIEGMEISDGQLYVNGVVFDRVNDAEKHRIAVEIMRMNHGDLGLMVLDRAEIFDSKSWEAFKAACKKAGLPIFAARVADSELTVRTEGKEVA